MTGALGAVLSVGFLVSVLAGLLVGWLFHMARP